MVRSRQAQKAGLTRAIKSGQPDRVYEECFRVVDEWEQTYWPDDWMNWQRALDDAVPWGQSVPLDDLRQRV